MAEFKPSYNAFLVDVKVTYEYRYVINKQQLSPPCLYVMSKVADLVSCEASVSESNRQTGKQCNYIYICIETDK